MPAVRGSRGRKDGDGVRAPTPLAAYRFRNREVTTDSGQPGKVINVMLGDDGQHYAVVDFGPDLGRHRVPVSSVAYERDKFVVHESDVRSLPSFVEGQAGLRLLEPGATIEIPGYRAAETDESAIFVQQSPPQVTVQRPALEINWEQAPPEVTVHQPTAHVNVRQLQPIIIVRQPPPRITVELEQPEIIVRMPDPEVEVAIAEPEVQVSVPKPSVRVVQPEEPQVRFTSGDPTVSLLPRSQAEVTLQRNDPNVRFERMGEPVLLVRQKEGEPRIRFEQITREEAIRAAGAAATMTTSGPSIIAWSASQLEGCKVHGFDGEEVGVIRRVLIGRNQLAYVVLERTGLLGFALQKILLPASDLTLQGNRILIRGMSAGDIGRLEAWNGEMDGYAAADADARVRFNIA
jgi:hypothetical protein